MASALDGDDWKSLYEGTFVARDPNDQLWKLAEEYHTRCDRYDEAVCTGRLHGDAFPADDHERRLSTRHAMQVLKEVRLKALQAGFATEQLNAMIREYSSATKR